jgi:hypothetical protein
MDYQNDLKEVNQRDFQKQLVPDTIEAKMELLNTIYICYPRFKEVLGAFDYCHHFSSCQDEPECLFLTGETGVGKTTIYRTYANRYPRKVTREKTIVPILDVTIPAPATVKTVVTKMLWKLGDPAYERGTIGIQTIRLINLLKNCGVELIILDEFQHFIDRDSAKVLQTVANWLKTLILDTNLPIILIGLPEAEQIFKLKSLSQLSRRFAHRCYLHPFTWDDDHGLEFRTFLHLLELELPLRELSHLSDEDMALRFYYASDGIVAYIMKLIRYGTYLALSQNYEQLNLNILAHAFEQYIRMNLSARANPFLLNETKLFALTEINNRGEKDSINHQIDFKSFHLKEHNIFKR